MVVRVEIVYAIVITTILTFRNSLQPFTTFYNPLQPFTTSYNPYNYK
jgi:hypothetical protein